MENFRKVRVDFMKKWILACGIIVIVIMGLQLTAQDVSGAEHINNQVALETTQTMMKIQATPRPLEMYDADGWKKVLCKWRLSIHIYRGWKGDSHRTI